MCGIQQSSRLAKALVKVKHISQKAHLAKSTSIYKFHPQHRTRKHLHVCLAYICVGNFLAPQIVFVRFTNIYAMIQYNWNASCAKNIYIGMRMIANAKKFVFMRSPAGCGSLRSVYITELNDGGESTPSSLSLYV